MAKAKQQELTLEEKLEQALVPESEWPYEVPGNWVWTRIIVLRENEDSFFDGDWILSENMDADGSVRLIQLSDIGIGEFLDKSSKYISERTYNELQCSKLFEGDVLISRMAEPIARSCIMPTLPYICITAVDVAVMRCNSRIVLNKYLNFLCNTSWFTDLAFKLARGTTRVRITRKNLGKMPFPLPPLAEQQRIVDRIESLFAKLDQAKELAQNALDTFETRKATILHKAFTGELTAKWREKNGVGMESWEECQLKDVCTVNPKKTNVKDLADDVSVTFVPMSVVSEVKGKVVAPEIKLLGEVKKGYTNFSEGDVIFAKITPCMENGKSAVVGKLLNGIGFGSTEFHVLRCTEKLYNHFLYHLVRNQSFRDKAKAVMTGAVGQQRVPKPFMEEYSLHLPSLPEQQEIVRILNNLFEKEQKAKELCDVIDKIDLMKKAILARAFRGELGTNDPSEESAVELLK